MRLRLLYAYIDKPVAIMQVPTINKQKIYTSSCSFRFHMMYKAVQITNVACTNIRSGTRQVQTGIHLNSLVRASKHLDDRVAS